jgi:hypothetical protein
MEGQIPHIQSLRHLRLTVHDPPATPRERPWTVHRVASRPPRGEPLGALKPRRATVSQAWRGIRESGPGQSSMTSEA